MRQNLSGKWGGSMKQKGVIALEFLLLFPIVIALVYAVAVYGVVFSWQVQMQIAVDRSTAAVMHLDRSATEDPKVAAEAMANQALNELKPSFIQQQNDFTTAAGVTQSAICTTNDTIVQCRLEKKSVDKFSLHFFGKDNLGFPPLPKELTATASVAY